MMKNIIIKLFGKYPEMKILMFLIEGRELDYSLSDIARGTGVSLSTCNRVWKKIENSDAVVFKRTVGRSRLFSINRKNKCIKLLIKDFDDDIKQIINEQ